jgi:uncharacterized protein YdaU (DUF1376 family)
MAADKAPAFQWYPRDFLSDGNVIVMSLQERGAYITLISHCWLDGSISDEPIRLARLCGVPLTAFRKLWPALERCFRPHPDEPGRLVHPRLEKERQKQEEHRADRSESGKRGAKSRWQKHGSAITPAMAQPSSAHGSAIVLPMAKNGSASASASAKNHPTKQDGSTPPPPPRGDGRADWLWQEWRRLMLETRGISLSPNPKGTDIPVLTEATDMVAEDDRLLAALERFMRLSKDDARLMSVR